MVSSRHEFHNNLRILPGIDRHEVVWMDDAQWAAFRDNPVRFFLKCDDEQLDLIWSVIVARQPRWAAE
jgi:hypothetical protein